MSISASRPNAVSRWFAEPKNACFFASLVIFIAVKLSFQPQTTEKFIGYISGTLQLLGIGAAIWGINDIRASFNLSTIASTLRSIFHPPYSVIKADSASAAASASAGNLIAVVENLTIEARVEALEAEIKRLKQTQEEWGTNLQAALKQEEQSRETEDSKIREDLKDTATGGVHIFYVGASWTIAGIILSATAKDIIEKLLK